MGGPAGLVPNEECPRCRQRTASGRAFNALITLGLRPAAAARNMLISVLYEPSGKGKGAERADREATIARIVAKAPATPGRAAATVRTTRTMQATFG